MDSGSSERFRLPGARAQSLRQLSGLQCLLRVHLARCVAIFWAEGLHLGLVLSFGTLVLITGLLIWSDRLKGQGTEAFYWLAIIFLRAGATNVGDELIHIFGLTFIVASLMTCVATLVTGFFMVPPFTGAISPLIDLRYWLAMGTAASSAPSSAISPRIR